MMTSSSEIAIFTEMKTLMLTGMVVLAGTVSGETLVSRNSYLMAVSPDARYLVYFRDKCCEPDEYREGDLYIYDVREAKSSLLNDHLYILNFVTAGWSRDGNSFYLSDGDTLHSFSFTSNEKKVVFATDEDRVIDFFTVSNNDSLIALNLLVSDAAQATQQVILVSLGSQERKTLYTIPDSSLGEELANRFVFDDETLFLYLRNLYGCLFSFNLHDGRKETLVERTLGLYDFIYGRFYYARRQGQDAVLCFRDQTDTLEHTLMRGTDMRVDFIGKVAGKLAVSLDDNVFLVSDSGYCKKLELANSGRFVFVNDSLAVQQRDRDLFFFKLH
ncbi:MAG: hypothetical protein NTW07_03660 [candidate division Zixibacteria bacterium]|nr:hypothetical protein [candidate division Zixibacteria bacterium]